MKLHHAAFKITPGHSLLIQQFCEFMGAQLVWEGFDQGKEIAMQFDNYFRIQFSEKDEKPTVSKYKQETHIAFLSDNPITDIEVVKNWFIAHHIEIKHGQWSEKEQWLDCPDVFVDFVIEIFKPKK